MPAQSDEIRQLLAEHRSGDVRALDALVPVLYDELRAIAANYLRSERPGHTLQTTALVHETYLRLVGQRDVEWQNKAHFFGVAAQIMRRLLVDHARSRLRGKRGGGDFAVPLDDALVAASGPAPDVLALDGALRSLAAVDEIQSRIVELRYFGGMTIEETAEVLGVSSMTVKRGWRLARAWLHRELKGSRR